MRVVAYSVKSTEKEPLAIANRKKHDITLIANSLGPETVFYAEGKDAVVVFTEDIVSAHVVNGLADAGIKYIATCSTNSSHIDQSAATTRNIRVANVPPTALIGLSHTELPMAMAMETINNLDRWQEKKCLGDACVCSRACDNIKNESEHQH